MADELEYLRLKDAARWFVGNSGINGRSLAREARFGRLRTYQIAGKIFTTRRDIEDMIRRQAREPSAPVLEVVDAEAAVARAEAAIEALRS